MAPVALPSAEPTPIPLPLPSPVPVATPTQEAAAAAKAPYDGNLWLWLTIAGVLLASALAAVFAWWRKRSSTERPEPRDDRNHEIFLLDQVGDAPPSDRRLESPLPPARPAAPPAAPVAPAAGQALVAAPRAKLEIEVRPKRAGTNLLSAAVEYAIVIQNAGEAAATGIRLDVRLLSAGRRQDAVLSALFAAPVANPVTAPFDLPVGSAVELGGMAMHPKDTLELLEVEGRALFVPVLAVNVDYAWDAGTGQTAMSFVIGIDRGGNGKLQPFRLDGAARMYDGVGALAYTMTSVR